MRVARRPGIQRDPAERESAQIRMVFPGGLAPARRRLDGYRAGRPVEVHYDPADPVEAVLQPSAVPQVRPLLVIAPMSAMWLSISLVPFG